VFSGLSRLATRYSAHLSQVHTPVNLMVNSINMAKELILIFFSWMLWGASYFAIYLEINNVYIPLTLSIIALLSSLSSLLIICMGLYKNKFFIKNYIYLTLTIFNTLVIFVFIKFFIFFVSF